MISNSHAASHREHQKRRSKALEGNNRVHSEIEVFQTLNDKTILESNISWGCREQSSNGSVSLKVELGGFFADTGKCPLYKSKLVLLTGDDQELNDLHILEEAKKYIPGRQVHHSPNIELGKSWLQSCQQNHSRCPQEPESKMPTRVIDVGSEDAQENNIVGPKLHISLPSASGQWAALSYCWGPSQNVILTLATLEAMKEAIPYNALPQTIADAVTTTRRLGLKYLWVDALCIIQDSATDWEKESANMGNIYNKSIVTIQASNASTSAAGFLQPRAEPKCPHSKLKLQLPDGRVDSVWVRYERIVDLWSLEPLHKRGWTLQEGLLAPRILRFDQSQMWWECSSTYHSEGGSQLEEQLLGIDLPKPIRSTIKKRPLIPEHILNVEARRRFTWALIVDDYTSRKISYASDKLEALSGLTNLIGRQRKGDEYLAGLWRSEMPLSLLWGGTRAERRLEAWRAPSWSWASLDCKTIILGVELSEYLYGEILHASVKPLGLNPLGQISSATLTIRGPLKRAWRILDEDTLQGDPEVQKLYESDRKLDPAISTAKQMIGLCGLDVFEPSQQLFKPIPTWCLRITEDRGLVLTQTGRDSWEYSRIGEFTFEENKWVWFDDCTLETITIV